MKTATIERWRIEDAHVAADGNAAALAGYAYLPASCPHPTTWLVSVHGISRRAQQHAQLLAPLAERLGLALATPRFTASSYADYQRLGRAPQAKDTPRQRGARADLALMRWLDALAAHTGVPAQRVWLTGFSGGAQFAHRFALAHPERVAGVISVSAGWYTWPDNGETFPRGCKPSERLPDLNFDLKALLALPIAALVGEHDTEAEPALRKTSRANAQGLHRRERAERWVRALHQAAAAQGIAAQITFDTLPRAAHSFRACVEQGGLRDKLHALLLQWQAAPTPVAARPLPYAALP